MKFENLRTYVLTRLKWSTRFMPLPELKDIGHGSLVVRPEKNGTKFRVYGGSFFNCPADMYGVKLAPELDLACDFQFPILDFGTPTLKVLVLNLKLLTIKGMQHREMYIGCYGGYGRTGLVIASLLIWNEGIEVSEAVQRVRKYIHPHCIETKGQHLLLQNLKTALSEKTKQELSDWAVSDEGYCS